MQGEHFCAGQELRALADTIGKEAKDLGKLVKNYYCPIVKQIVSATLPVVAAVKGVAAGAIDFEKATQACLGKRN